MAQIEIAAMDPDQIIKAAPELLKHGAELVGALKLTEIAKAMLGPATGEFAERVLDEIRLYRFGRQLELLKKAEKMVEDAGFTPKAVPIKLLFPLLEGASFEENEDLHTMWAALLANASSPEDEGRVRPGFIAILKQMAPDEAALLNALYDGVTSPNKGDSQETIRDGEWAKGVANMILPLERLQAQLLVMRPLSAPSVLTGSGYAFVRACQPPKPKA